MKRAARCSASLHTPSCSTFRTFRNVPARNRRGQSRLDFALEKMGLEISLSCPVAGGGSISVWGYKSLAYPRAWWLLFRSFTIAGRIDAPLTMPIILARGIL